MAWLKARDVIRPRESASIQPIMFVRLYKQEEEASLLDRAWSQMIHDMGQQRKHSEQVNGYKGR